jgi:hypothetical protein
MCFILMIEETNGFWFLHAHTNNILTPTCYWLLILGGIIQSVRSTAAIFRPIVRPHMSSNTPDVSTSALWLPRWHLAVTQAGGEKCPWNLLTWHLIHSTCRKVLLHVSSGFTSHQNEGVLRIFIAIKNPSPRPHPLGPVACTLTTTSPMRLLNT